jgi:hypothetical protein
MSATKDAETEVLEFTRQETTEISEKVIRNVGKGDKETRAYITGPPVRIDEATNKRLFWKINRRILVIMLITYFCQSLDKGTLNFASIMGIKTDAHLVGQEVSAIP